MSQLTQDSVLAALVALRKHHPKLTTICWEIGSYCPEGLRGSAHTGGRDLAVLEEYATIIGGRIEETHTFTTMRGDMQAYALKGQWADMPIVLTGMATMAEAEAYRQTHPQAVAA